MVHGHDFHASWDVERQSVSDTCAIPQDVTIIGSLFGFVYFGLFGLNYVFVFFVGFAPNVLSSRLSVFLSIWSVCTWQNFISRFEHFTLDLFLKITGALENLFCLLDKDMTQAPLFPHHSPPAAGCIQILDVDTGLLSHTLRSHPSIFLKIFVLYDQ